MTALVAFYSLYTARRLDNRPEDDQMAEPGRGRPRLRVLQPPLVVAVADGLLSAMMIALGLIFATWLMIAGVVFLVLSTIGLVFEYYRGDFAH
jgi:hypothetical protein